MKRLGLTAILLVLLASLTACGSKDSAAAQNESSTRQAAGGAQAEDAMDAALSTGEEVPGQIAAQGDLEGKAAEAAARLTSAATGERRAVDLDLTQISGTVVYSQVYDMMQNPKGYMGQRIRMKGSFSYFQDPDTKQEYFATVIADATACCAQGIEFVWEGEHSYPRDYPPLDTEITVTGTFSTYFEGDYMYVQLVDAEVEWDE